MHRVGYRARAATDPNRYRPMRARASRRHYVLTLCERLAMIRRAERAARCELVVTAAHLPSVLHPDAVRLDLFVAPSEQRRVSDPAGLALHRWRNVVRRWALMFGVPLSELHDAGLWPTEPPGEPVDRWTAGPARTEPRPPTRTTADRGTRVRLERPNHHPPPGPRW